MNAELLTAIQTKWNASSGLTSRFLTDLWVSRAADAATLPVCVLSLVANGTDYSTCTSRYLENVVVQFTAYASDDGNDPAPTVLLTAADDIEAAFNNKAISLTTDKVLMMRKLTGGLPYAVDAKVWRIDVEYTIVVQRNV